MEIGRSKGRAESLKRKLEYQDGFGWSLSGKDLSDYLVRIPERTRKKIENRIEDNYFASKEAVGPKRALENLQESAWWSKELSGTMLGCCSAVTIILLLGALITLVISISTATDFDTLRTVNRVIVSLISFVVSFGLLKLIISYHNFGRKSDIAEQASCNLLKAPSPDEVEVLKLLHEYQIARNAAPPVPDFVWRLRRRTLNDLWDKYRCS